MFLGFLPCQTSTRCDTPAAIGCFGTLYRLQQGCKAGDYHPLHLSRLPLLQGDLETAQHSQEVLQQVATYVTLVHEEEIPLAVDLLKQSAAKKEICEGNCIQVSSM